MKVKVNIREHLEGATDHNGELHVNASIDMEDLFEGNAIPEEQEIDVDIDELLAEERKIADIWGIAEVQAVRADLDDNAAWDVLQSVRDALNSRVGITWDTIERAANELYPKPEGPWQGRIDISVTNYERDAAIEFFTGLAKDLERIAVNSTTRASFDLASLRLVEPQNTTGK